MLSTNNIQCRKEKHRPQLEKPVAPVKYYIIYRGKSGKRSSSLTSVEGNLTNISDTSMTGKGIYRYMIRAIYAEGGESPLLCFQEVEVK